MNFPLAQLESVESFLSAYDIHKYTKGANKELGLHSQTLQCVAKEYVKARKQFKKSRLNWRKTKGVRRSLGWIPVNTNASRWKNGQIYHNGNYFGVWDSFGLSNYKFRTASFNEDARGRVGILTWSFLLSRNSQQGLLLLV